MNERGLKSLIWIIAVSVLVSGIGMTGLSIYRVNDVVDKANQKQLLLKELKVMEGKAEKSNLAVKKFEDLSSKRLAPLDVLIKQAIPENKAEEIRKAEKKEVEGWTIVRNEVSFGDIPLEKLLEFLVKAESSRPPWRLVKCVIKSNRTPGTGRVVVELEGIGK